MEMWITLDEIYEQTSLRNLEEQPKVFTLCEIPDVKDQYYQIAIKAKEKCVNVTLRYGWKRWTPDGKTYTAMIPETPPIFHCKVNVDNWEDTRGMMIVAAYNTANILCEAREVKRQIQESVSR